MPDYSIFKIPSTLRAVKGSTPPCSIRLTFLSLANFGKPIFCRSSTGLSCFHQAPGQSLRFFVWRVRFELTQSRSYTLCSANWANVNITTYAGQRRANPPVSCPFGIRNAGRHLPFPWRVPDRLSRLLYGASNLSNCYLALAFRVGHNNYCSPSKLADLAMSKIGSTRR